MGGFADGFRLRKGRLWDISVFVDQAAGPEYMLILDASS